MRNLVVMLVFITTLVLKSSSAVCQANYGNSWVFGVGGVSFLVDFDNTNPTVEIFDSTSSPWFKFGHSNICDSIGNLILASDGFNVYGTNRDTIDGGYNLTPEQIIQVQQGYSRYSQSSIFLPIGNGKYYFITPTASDNEVLNHWIPAISATYDLLLYSVIDMNANGGSGKVTKRKISLLENVKMSKTQMMACKHGDGKSWWLLKMAQDTNMVYKFLFTKDSVYGPYIQGFTEPLFSYDNAGQSVFSKDGTKFATTTRGTKKVFVADFDRCSGELSSPLVYDVPEAKTHNPFDSTETEPWTEGVAFSPNGRFLYVSKYFNIQQLDLQDSNPNTAWENVAGLDTTWDAFPDYASIYLGPDDKLYLGYWSGTGAQMSYFKYPDNKGASSGFCQRCLHFPGFYYQSTYYHHGVTTPPCMPNYKLGPTNPICWPSGVEPIPAPSVFNLYPNPSSGFIFIETSEPGSIQFYDVLGKLCKSLPVAPGAQKLIQTELAAGVYSWQFTGTKNLVKRGKLIVLQ